MRDMDTSLVDIVRRGQTEKGGRGEGKLKSACMDWRQLRGGEGREESG